MVEIPVGALVLHSHGPCARVKKVWEPGTWSPSPATDPPLTCAVVELESGDFLVLDERRAANFAVVPKDVSLVYEALILPACQAVARAFAAKLGPGADRGLVGRLLRAAMASAVKAAL